MSTQIAVRLPDDLVAEMDALVAAGHARSRADILTTAMRRDARRRAAERDAEILRSAGAADDLDDLVTWSSEHATRND